MFQLRHKRDLPHESLERYGTSELRTKNFDGDQLIVTQVSAKVDGRHSSATKLALHVVVLREQLRSRPGRDLCFAGDGGSVRRCQNVAIFRTGRGSQALSLIARLHNCRADRNCPAASERQLKPRPSLKREHNGTA